MDDDRFEDISTSNREGYKKDDIRVKKLLEIVGKIVNKLVHARASKGSEIRDELREYMEAKRKAEEEKKEAPCSGIGKISRTRIYSRAATKKGGRARANGTQKNGLHC